MRQRNLRILVVDDHALMRHAVRLALEGEEGLELVGEAETAAQAVEQATALEPDLVLLDLVLPGAEGLSCLDALKRACPSAIVVVFTGVEDRELLRAALARGAAALVLKHINPADLPGAIRQVVERSFFQPDEAPAPDARPGGLSEKELGVLEQLAQGRSNREIARALWISDQTVKFHLRNVYRKLGASSRTDAIRIAHERAMLALPL